MPTTKVTKAEILAQCWEVFHRNGYAHTSIQMLADASGLGKAGILHHFGSKEGAMREVLHYSIEAFKAYVLAPATEALPPEQQLEKLLRRQNRLAKKDRRGCFYANIGSETGQDGTFNTLIESAFGYWLGAVSGIFMAAHSAEDARSKAYQLLLEYEGSVLIYKLSGEESHLDGVVTRAVESFKNALQNR